jgi:hypothetical protein
MSGSQLNNAQLDLFPPYTINKTRSGRFMVRTLEDGHGIKARVDALCEHCGGRYIEQESGYTMTERGVAKMEAAYAAAHEQFPWLLDVKGS